MDGHALTPALSRGEREKTPLGDVRLAQRLRRETSGEVLFSRGDRGRYSTDASIYQVEPVGVLVPRTIGDVEAGLAIAREHGVPVLARGGGTSQCGQTVNRALVIDYSKYLRSVLELDVVGQTAWVEPGIVLNHLNTALKPHGLFFPVDPSTHARATIGGMTANNSCGSKSIRYGLMADNVLAIDALLADGTRVRFGEDDGPEALMARLRAIGAAEAEEIAARFPTQLRRVGGYNIQVLVPGAEQNLARLLVGSEGTLALSAAIRLQLQRIKPRRVLGICQFPTFRAAMAATKHLVELGPEAVELVDRTMIDLGRGIEIYRKTIDRMVLGEPDSLLIVEFHGDDEGVLLGKLAELDQAMGDLGYPGAVVRATEAGFQGEIAAVREAGLNIMMSMKGDGKPVSFIEDCAVGLDDLADYTERLNDVFARHGTKGTWYAHASVGCLHVRPVLNMKDPADIRTMRAVAEECFALVREYKGSHSGEHGDGIVRSEFHAEMFGARIVSAFEAVKDAFDPAGTLNPNRVVRPPRMDDVSLFRYGPEYVALPVAPVLDWGEYTGPVGGMLAAVEMCNNNGTCRAFEAGSMCPSYRVTRDEEHLTRGRANTLRLALTGQLGAEALASDDVHEALKLMRVVQGLPAGVSDRGRYGEDEDRGHGGAGAGAWGGGARAGGGGVAAVCGDRAAFRAGAELPQPVRRDAKTRRAVGVRGRATAAGVECAGAAVGCGRPGAERRRLAVRGHVQPEFRAGEHCGGADGAAGGGVSGGGAPKAVVLRADVSGGRAGRAGAGRGAADPGGARWRAAGGGAGAVLPADDAGRVPVVAAGRGDR